MQTEPRQPSHPASAPDRPIHPSAGNAGETPSQGEAETFQPPWRANGDGRGRPRKPGETILGRYVVERELGQGAMGVVYGCFDRVGGVRVAVKGLPPELNHDTAEMEDVRENFRLVSALRHPNIAGVRTLEQEPDGECFLVMDVAEGESLRSWLRRRKRSGGVSLAETIALLRQIASALDYAHGERVMHRDIKPGNVMIDSAGRVKVLDLGLAAQIRTSLSHASRLYRGTSGTGPYMAPEQWRGRPQDGRADQYALAVMAYEMLAGVLPFESQDPAILKASVLEEPVMDIPGLASAPMRVLRRALAKDPADRWPSCTAFVDALASGKGAGRAGRASSSRGGFRALFVPLALAAGIAVGMWWQNGAEGLRRQAEDSGRVHSGQDATGPAEWRDELADLAGRVRGRAERFNGDFPDLGKTFGQTVGTMRAELEQGENALAEGDCEGARAAFEASLAAADWLEERAPEGEDAARARDAARQAENQARDALAPSLSGKAFQAARALADKAQTDFDDARFGDAEQKWNKASGEFQGAAGKALARRRQGLSGLAQNARSRCAAFADGQRDLGRSFNERLAAMRSDLERGEKAKENGDLVAAQAAFEASLAAADWLDEQALRGEDAARARDAAREAETQAREALASSLSETAFQEVRALMDEAQADFDDVRFGDAEQKWNRAAAEYQSAVADVQNQYRQALSELARNARDRSAGFADFQADFGRTFNEKLAAMRSELERGEKAEENGDWATAQAAFEASLAAADWLEERTSQARAAVQAREAADHEKEQARAVFAENLDGEAFRTADGLMEEARGSFESAEFDQAAQKWNSAAAAFQKSAKAARAVLVARELLEGRQALEEQRWDDAVGLLGEALALAPENGMVSKLFQKATQERDAANARNREATIQRLLEEGRQALHDRLWDEAIDKANLVLDIDAGNQDASSLRDAAIRYRDWEKGRSSGTDSESGEEALPENGGPESLPLGDYIPLLFAGTPADPELPAAAPPPPDDSRETAGNPPRADGGN